MTRRMSTRIATVTSVMNSTTMMFAMKMAMARMTIMAIIAALRHRRSYDFQAT